MSLVLAGAADSITYVLDAAPATNQLPASVYYALQGGAGNQANTLSAGTTPVTILAGSGTAAIVVNSLVIPNRDTATRTVTVNMVTGAGTFEQVQVILASGSHLNYSSGNGWYVMDKNGNFLETVTVTGGTLTVTQGTAAAFTAPWPVILSNGSVALGTTATPLSVFGAGQAVGSGQITGTTSVSLSGATTRKFITALTIYAFNATLAAGVVQFSITDSTGSKLIFNIPTGTSTGITGLIYENSFLSIPIVNTVSVGTSASLGTNLTSGNFFVFITVI